jgi:hypothetical protein
VRSSVPGGPCRYRVPVEQLYAKTWALAVVHGLHPINDFYFNESAPDEHLTLQGEFTRQPSGWYMQFSKLQLPMRKALEQAGEHAYGLRVLLLLRSYANPRSFDMLMELVDTYDQDPLGECVIEFSCYDVCLGRIPMMNTVVWECRAF